MTRETVRHWKRALRGSAKVEDGSTLPACDAAINLLERSIRFGHSRLAVLRLVSAVQAGAQPTTQHWSYCSEAALRSGDRALEDLLEQACALSASAGGQALFSTEEATQ